MCFSAKTVLVSWCSLKVLSVSVFAHGTFLDIIASEGFASSSLLHLEVEAVGGGKMGRHFSLWRYAVLL